MNKKINLFISLYKKIITINNYVKSKINIIFNFINYIKI